MEEVPDILSTSLRWGTPLAGMVISLLAWRKFRSPGIGWAAAGFAVMLIGPVVRLALLRIWEPDQFRSASEIAAILTLTGALGTVGMVVVVLSMRRMIAGARQNLSASPDATGGDQ